jgi:hypothetical protein
VCNPHFTPKAARGEKDMDTIQAINEAIKAFHIATTPDALDKAVRASIEAGSPQTENDVVFGAATLLEERVQKAVELQETPCISECSVRARAKRLGYRVCKSRERTYHSNNKGAFQLIDYRNIVILGVDFDASLEDIATFLAELAR